MYAIRYDGPRRMLCVVMFGLWDEPTLVAYTRALADHVAALIGRGEKFGVLIDGRTIPVQRQALTPLFQNILPSLPSGYEASVSGLAIVCGSILNQVQVRRLFGESVLMFDDIDLAEQCLRARLSTLIAPTGVAA